MESRSSRFDVCSFIVTGLTFVGRQCGGLTILEERGRGYLDIDPVEEICFACALGLALIGKYHDPWIANRSWSAAADNTLSPIASAARLLGISAVAAAEIDAAHQSGKSAIQIVQDIQMRHIVAPVAQS